MKENSNLEYSLHATDIQAGMLFDALRSEYNQASYIVQTILQIKNTFYKAAFLRAFEEIIRRHSQLRCAFDYNHADHAYIQCVYKNVKVPCIDYDYTNKIEAEKEKHFSSFLKTDIHHEFQLSIPPLMRLAIFKFSENDFRIVWTRHHVLLDGESVKIIVNELMTSYQDIVNGRELEFNIQSEQTDIYRFPVVYDEAECKSYWKKMLTHVKGSAFLPEVIKNTAEKTLETILEKMSVGQYSRLRKFIRSYDLTTNTLLEASWAVTLSHYSCQSHVVFGSVRAYPRSQMSQDCVGLFINTLPIKININLSDKVLDFLKKMRGKNRQLKRYINTPLKKIREFCNLSSENPIYQSIIDYKPESLHAFLNKNFPELSISAELRLNIPYPMMLEVIGEDNTLKFKLHYACHLFTHEYAQLILNHFIQTLDFLCEHFENKISDLPISLNQDLKKIELWNQTEQAFPTNNTVHQLFEQQVIKTPTAPALMFEEQTITYQELNQRANQLANDLIQLEVCIESFVVIYLPSGIELIVAILAVLKAGGIYVPVDIHYPSERVKFLVQDSQPKIMITDAKRIQSITHEQIHAKNYPLFYNIDDVTWDDKRQHNLNVPVKPENGMYMVYTSGSTGTPKGVLIEHRSAINMAYSCIQTLQIDPSSRTLQIASVSFDVFAAEWCMTLLAGATLCLMDRSMFAPDIILQKLKDYQVSTIILASTILSVLPKENLPALKVIACGGEFCSLDVIHFWSKNRLFLNIFGITESSVCSTAAEFKSDTFNCNIIGKPLANTKIFILNADQQMLPIGVSGEMYIGGMGLARQYHNNPLLTQEKFMRSVISSAHGDNHYLTLYKTGDIARWLPQGQLEFVGRKDDQIKIRGFRLELGEIERVLEKYPSVIKAIVLLKPQVNNQLLVAYLFTKIKEMNVQKVKNFIQEQLPSYMIPNQIILIDHVPLTPNGKIDKEKLLAIEYRQQSLDEIQLSDQDKIIVNIIKSILNLETISCSTNFFDLGFDSISIVRFSSELTQKFNQKISVIDLFTYTTVKDISNYISNLSASSAHIPP